MSDNDRGITLQASRLYGVAAQAHIALSKGEAARESEKHNAWVCIVFAAFAVEAWMNELSRYQSPLATMPLPLMGEMLEIAEQRRYNVEQRYCLAMTVLTSKRVEK